LLQYNLQREQELRELQQRKQEEIRMREMIEREKLRLIQENEDILKAHFSKGYQKSINSLQTGINNNPSQYR
jgi:hypothetical protein